MVLHTWRVILYKDRFTPRSGENICNSYKFLPQMEIEPTTYKAEASGITTATNVSSNHYYYFCYIRYRPTFAAHFIFVPFFQSKKSVLLLSYSKMKG